VRARTHSRLISVNCVRNSWHPCWNHTPMDPDGRTLNGLKKANKDHTFHTRVELTRTVYTYTVYDIYLVISQRWPTGEMSKYVLFLHLEASHLLPLYPIGTIFA